MMQKKLKNKTVKCGWCEKEKIVVDNPRINSKHYFCNRLCMSNAARPGGVLFEEKKQTCLKHFGCESHNSAQSVKETKRNICKEKYGVENPFQVEAIKNDIRLSLLQKFGVEYTSQVPESRIKARETSLKHWGFENPRQSPIIKEKSRQTCFERYGEDNSWKKQHETKKRLKIYSKSKVEDLLYESLIQKFGCDDVERQVLISHENRSWAIDFYIKSINTYVQMDGVYWHGLDRPLEVIKESQGPRDKSIYQVWHNDCYQDKWFHEHNMKLIRITDKDFYKIGIVGIF
jgi:hypothetical protein